MIEMGTDQQMFNRMMTSFENKNPIDLSIDPSRVTTTDPQASPTNAKCSHIRDANGGGNQGDFSQFCDDQQIMDLLIENEDDYLGGKNLFYEIDMGQMDEEDKQYLLIDKDTGRVYDLRNEDQLTKIAKR